MIANSIITPGGMNRAFLRSLMANDMHEAVWDTDPTTVQLWWGPIVEVSPGDVVTMALFPDGYWVDHVESPLEVVA